MNTIRRKQLDEIITALGHAKAIVENIASEEQDSFDTLGESLQHTPQGEAMEDAIAHLDQAVSNLEDAIDNAEAAKGGS